MKVTNRRVNALDNVTIPRIEKIISYILRELDELEREDFVRIKKVQANKKRDEKEKEITDAAEAEMAALSVDKHTASTFLSSDHDILAAFEPSMDEDVVF